jgi:hypothetical protein
MTMQVTTKKIDREVLQHAQVLMTWSRGKSMKLVGGTIHKCGEKMTRISPEQIKELIDAGLMTRTMVGVKIRCEAVAKAKEARAL